MVTKIGNTSPLKNSIEVNSIIVEAQKIKIKNAKDLQKIVKDVLNQIKKQFYLQYSTIKIKEDILVLN